MRILSMSPEQFHELAAQLANGQTPTLLLEALGLTTQPHACGPGCRPSRREERLVDICGEVFNEVERASRLHSPFNSAHEGLSVLEEELHELRLEVYKKTRERDPAKLYQEAIQTAAMAVRFVFDIVDKIPKQQLLLTDQRPVYASQTGSSEDWDVNRAERLDD